MRRISLTLLFALALLSWAQKTTPAPISPPDPSQDVQLPNGKSQQEELLKLDHKKNLEDSATLAKLAEEVSEDLEKNDRYVVSLKTIKKLDEIERLTKAIRGRLKKF